MSAMIISSLDRFIDMARKLEDRGSQTYIFAMQRITVI